MENPVPIHLAKAHLSALISKALAGEIVIIANGKTPVVQLVPISSNRKIMRKFGAFKGKASVSKLFFEPLPEDELKAWE